MDAHVHCGTVCLLPLDPLDVNPDVYVKFVQSKTCSGTLPEFGPVALNNLADLLALVVTAHNLGHNLSLSCSYRSARTSVFLLTHLDLVILPDRHGADSVLGLQLLKTGL